jgi:hypothetical protein
MKSKNLFKIALISVLVLSSCTKDDDPVVSTTPPSTTLPPPTVAPPVLTPPTPEVPPSYSGGDISITSQDELDYYQELVVKNVTGDLNLDIDWVYVDGSTNDPSVFTKNIETVSGDVTVKVSVSEELSFENLVRVDGNYSVSGRDVFDDNLLHAKTIELDYPGDYEIKAIFTDEVRLNLGDDQTSKSASSSKIGLRNVDVHAYHTSLLADTDFTPANLPSIRTIAPVMPATPIYPSFVQTDHTESKQIVSNNISSITFSGHVVAEKIVSTSLTTLSINNSHKSSLEVISSSLTTLEMPNVAELNSLSITAPSLQSFVALSLVKVLTKITLSGILNVEFSSLISVGAFEVISGSNIKLPKLAALPTNTIFPSNIRVESSVAGIAQSGVTASGGSTTDGHSSGGSGHSSGGSGHSSGGSGHTSGTSGG